MTPSAVAFFSHCAFAPSIKPFDPLPSPQLSEARAQRQAALAAKRSEEERLVAAAQAQLDADRAAAAVKAAALRDQAARTRADNEARLAARKAAEAAMKQEDAETSRRMIECVGPGVRPQQEGCRASSAAPELDRTTVIEWVGSAQRARPIGPGPCGVRPVTWGEGFPVPTHERSPALHCPVSPPRAAEAAARARDSEVEAFYSAIAARANRVGQQALDDRRARVEREVGSGGRAGRQGEQGGQGGYWGGERACRIAGCGRACRRGVEQRLGLIGQEVIRGCWQARC